MFLKIQCLFLVYFKHEIEMLGVVFMKKKLNNKVFINLNIKCSQIYLEATNT